MFQLFNLQSLKSMSSDVENNQNSIALKSDCQLDIQNQKESLGKNEFTPIIKENSKVFAIELPVVTAVTRGLWKS